MDRRKLIYNHMNLHFRSFAAKHNDRDLKYGPKGPFWVERAFLEQKHHFGVKREEVFVHRRISLDNNK